MSFELEKENLKIYESLRTANSKSILNADIIIPDSKPDVINILEVSAFPSIEEKRIQNGNIYASGIVNYTILYSGGDEEIKINSISYTSPFKEEFAINDAEENSNCYALADISHIESAIENSRKINIKTVLNFEACAISEKSVSALCSVTSDTNIPQRKRSFNILEMSVCSQNTFFVSDELRLSQGSGVVDEILKTDIKIAGREFKLMNNKIVLKGSILTDTLYLSEGELYHTENETPFTEVIDAEGLNASMDTEVKYSIHSFKSELSPSDAENAVSIEAGVDVVVKAYEENSYDVVSDIYSPDYEIEAQKETHHIKSVSESFRENFTINEMSSLNDGAPDMLRVLSFTVNPHIESITASDGYATIEGYLNSKILYLSDSENSPLYSVSKKVPLSLRLNNKKLTPDSILDVDVNLEHSGYVLKSERDFEVRASLKTSGKILSQDTMEIISDVEIREDSPLKKDNQPGIVIYFADKDEDLWDIAKRYNTTSEEIASLNSIDINESLTERQQLIIPKRLII